MTITTLTGLSVQPESVNGTIPTSKIHGFYVPRLTTAQITALATESPLELRNGGVVYNTTLNIYQVYETYVTSNVAPLTTSAWVPLLSIPTMTAAQGAFFEADNTIQGQMYGRSDTNVIRIYIGDAWNTITTA
jgi:hypothetical protein